MLMSKVFKSDTIHCTFLFHLLININGMTYGLSPVTLNVTMKHNLDFVVRKWPF